MVNGQIRFSRPVTREGQPVFTPSGPSIKAEIRRISGTGRQAPTPTPVLSRAEQNRIFEEFRAGSISRSAAIGRLQGSEAKQAFQQRVEQEKRIEKREIQLARTEKIRGALLRREDPRLLDLPKTDVSDLRPAPKPGPSLVDIPRELTLAEKIRFSAAGQFIEKTARRGSELTTFRETVTRDEPIDLGEQQIFIPDVKTEEFAFGQGTPTVTSLGAVRIKTFEEKIGAKKSKDSEKLEKDLLSIQSDFATGKITEQEAKAKVDEEFTNFVTAQTIRNIPRTLALLAGVVVLSRIPLIGPVIGRGIQAAFIGEAFVKRKIILERFKKFPKASAIETATFLAGGLLGVGIGAGIGKGVGKFKAPKITEASLSSVVQITGQQKTRLINEVSTANPNFQISRQQGRITGVSTYKVTLNDGRSFQIVEFSKLSPGDKIKGLSGERNFLGFEVGKDPRFAERIIGKGVAVTKGGEAEVFIRAVRFKPIDNKVIDVLSQQFGFNKGKTIEVLAKSTAIPLGKGKFDIITESRIKAIKNTQRPLALKIRQIQNKLDRGAKLSQTELKSLINLERRSQELSPFTEAEFRAAGFSTITKTAVQTILGSAELTFTKNANLISKVFDTKTGFAGVGFTAPGKIQPGFIKPGKIVKTPLAKTFGPPKKAPTPSLVASGRARLAGILERNKARNNRRSEQAQKPLSQRINEAQQLQKAGGVGKAFGKASEFAGKGEFEQVAATTASGIAKALAPQLNVRVQTLTPIVASISRLTLAERILLKDSQAIDSRLSFNEKQLFNLKNDLKTKQAMDFKNDFVTKSISKIKQDIKQNQGAKSRLISLQKLNLRLKQTNITTTQITTIPIIPAKPRPPFIPFKGMDGVEKRRPLIPKLKNQGFHAFAKQKGIFKKINRVPVSKKKAKDMAAFVVDNSTSARGKIVRAIGKSALKPQRKVPKNYFNRTSNKYRAFKIVAGKNVPLINEFIEKRAKRIDTFGEKRGLNAAKSISKLKKRKIKPTKAFKSDGTFKKKIK